MDEINFDTQYDNPIANNPVEVLEPILKVIGVGGAGNNAINHMAKMSIDNVGYGAINTDAQALAKTNIPAEDKLQLGESGRGAGTKPDVAQQFAEEKTEEIRKLIGNETKMLFLTAGLGKGTGTGASPVVARIAKDMGVLTVAIVCTPFEFEGPDAVEKSDQGIAELKKSVDAIIEVQNEKIFLANEDQKMNVMYDIANDVLGNSVKCIANIINETSFQNVDFNDVVTTLADSGEAMFGIAEASGADRIRTVLSKAMTHPLIDDSKIQNGKSCLLFISASEEHFVTGGEMKIIRDEVRSYIAKDAKVIVGMGMDDSLGENVKVSILVTRFSANDDGFDPLKDSVGNVKPVSEPTIVPQSPVAPINPSDVFDFDAEARAKAEQTVVAQAPVQKPVEFEMNIPAPAQAPVVNTVAPTPVPAPTAPQIEFAVPQTAIPDSNGILQPEGISSQSSQSSIDNHNTITFQQPEQIPWYDTQDDKVFESNLNTSALQRTSGKVVTMESNPLPKPTYLANGFLFGQTMGVD